ncbi:MAG TPA: MFS transporter [Kineosporiaceae bacterium]
MAPAPRPPDVGRRREQRSWYWYDWANSAYVTTTLTVLFTPYLTDIAKRAACPGQDTALACRTPLHLLAVPISPGSLALYTITASTLLSAVLLPVVGAAVDRTGRKRTLLARIAWVGAAAASAMVFLGGTRWWLGVVLGLVAQLCLGCTLVIYDAILVDIALPDERDAVSSRGWAFGYIGGGLLLAINLVMVTAHRPLGLSTEWAVRLSLLSAGLWWGGFTLVPFFGLRDRPPVAVEELAARGPVGAAFRQLWVTLRDLPQYPQTMLFLLGYLFYNDGIQTVIYASSLFGQEQLHLSKNALIITILVVQFVGFAGAMLFGALAARIGAHRTVLLSLVLWCLVVTAGYFAPDGQFLPFLVLGSAIGLVLGGAQALSRSLYSQLVPRGREAEYFSLYQATERGTSWFGTLLFGLIYQFTGSYREAIVALVVFFVLGGSLLWRVRMREGIRDAGNDVPAVV